jgi:ABC-2 type transport system permease protein
MTKNGTYTISAVSKNLFKEIPDQIQITYFISEKLAKIHPLPKEIEDLLYEYAANSRGKIRISVLDPSKEGSESAAEQLGVVPQQIQVVEQNEQTVATVYTGIVIQYLDRYDTMPVIFSTETLEYDLTSRIRAIVKNTSKALGVIVGDSGKSYSTDFATLQRILQKSFSVNEIQPGEDLPDDVSVLFVLGATKLDAFDLYPIDQFLMRGGRVLFAVQGVDVDSQQTLAATAVLNDEPLNAIASYGVAVRKVLALDKSCLTVPFRMASPYGGSIINLVQYPHWINVRAENVSATNPITSRFAGLSLFWPSPLDSIEVPGVKAEAIINTTPQGWLQTANFMTTPEYGPESFYGEADTTTKQYALAYALSGTFPSYFAGKPIPTRKDASRDWKDTAKESPETRVIVIGDDIFATELQTFTNNSNNADFLLNCAVWLSSDDDILSIKTRAAKNTSLDRIQDPAVRKSAAVWVEAVNVGIIPLIVIAFAVYRMARRKKLQQRALPEAGNEVQD